MNPDLRDQVYQKIQMPRLRIERALIVTESYRNTEGEPAILRRAKALRDVLHKIPIAIQDWQLIVGSPSAEPFTVSPNPEASWRWVLTELDHLSTREGDKFFVSENDKELLKDTLQWWNGKSWEDVILNLLPPQVAAAFETGLLDSGYLSSGVGNFTLDYHKVLSRGFLSIIDEIKEKMEALKLSEQFGIDKWLYYNAALICCEAMIDHAQRYAELAKTMAEKESRKDRKRELEIIARNCETVPAYPADNIFQALQSFWFTHALVHHEVAGSGGVVAGRLDQYLFPYVKGTEKQEIKRWLENLWINYNQIMLFLPKRTSFLWSGNPIGEQPTIGGMNEDGEDACNEITELILEVEKEVRLPQPDIAMMYHRDINEDTLHKACETLPASMKPKFFNFDIASMQAAARGATLKEARKGLVNIGCLTCGIEGSIWGTNLVYLNLVKSLELALNDGIDPLTGRQIGPRTGSAYEMTKFDDLMNAFKNQLKFGVELASTFSNLIEKVHGELNPQPLASVLIDDHLDKGSPPWNGGARLDMQGINGVGFATLVDSLAAVKKVVFDDGDASMNDLLEACHSNFHGQWEMLRQKLIHRAPKFGNDDDYVDSIAKEVSDIYCQEVIKYHCRRGSPLYPSLHSVSAHVGLGLFIGATPNGRKSKLALSDGMSPSQGMCFNGPTAVIKSSTKIDHAKVVNGALLNMKFNKSLLKDPVGIQKFIGLLKAFMDLGGYHLQFNIIDTRMLRDAQLYPEKYPDLLVRVAAYVAQFGQLPKDLQDDIINRTELDVM